MREAFIKTLKHRGLIAFVVDEGNHLMKVPSGRRLNDQMDNLKSLANEAQIIFILMGTYEMLPLRNLSGQLARRSIDIHFPRYNIDVNEHVDQFKSAVKSLQAHVPCPVEPKLINHWEFLYEQSIGCIGNLKTLLVRSLELAFDDKAETIELEHLQASTWQPSQVERMLEEARKGEREYAYEGEKKDKSPHKVTKGNRQVGTRNPTRDPVGAGNQASASKRSAKIS